MEGIKFTILCVSGIFWFSAFLAPLSEIDSGVSGAGAGILP